MNAIRVQQGSKSSVVDTLGGYFRDVMYSEDPQYNGLLLPDVTLEGTTGAAYRAELEQIRWIFQHSGDRKPDNSPADTYFFELSQLGAYQDVVRASSSAIGWLIHIQNFGYDDTVSNAFEIKFSFRCKLLRDVYGGLPPQPPVDFYSLPDVSTFTGVDPNTALGLVTPEPVVFDDLASPQFGVTDLTLDGLEL